MEKITLSNGVAIVFYDCSSDSISIQATVKVGSNYEPDKLRGISHFVEHLLFEGTKSRTGQQITSEIEGVGGEIGAFTTNTRTCYHIKVLNRHYFKAVDVLLDMLTNPLFDKKDVQKEKSIIISEIRMGKDVPRIYQWELFQQALYKANPAKHPIIGYEKTVKSAKRNDILSHFKKFYVPSNIIISVVGKITNEVKEKVISSFGSIPDSASTAIEFDKEPPQKEIRIKKIKKESNHSYLVIGYNAVQRAHNDSYVIDVIRGILGRPLSGRLFRHIRQEKALCYDIGAHYEDEIGYGFFAVYLSTDKSKLSKAKSLILEQISKVDIISEKELDEVKNFLEGEFLLSMEDTQKRADNLAFWEYAGNAGLSSQYISSIRKITVNDISRVKKAFFSKYAMAVIEQK